jgi:hypothetical protein
VERRLVESIIGDTPQADIDIKEIIAEVQKRYHLFYVFATEGSYSEADVLDDSLPGRGSYYSDGSGLHWRPLLGQNAILLDDASAVCETVAATVGLMEGAVTLDDAMDDLADVGADTKAIEATSRALATVGAGASVTASSSGELPGLDD